nr:hypothetical protein [Aeropyrum camini]
MASERLIPERYIIMAPSSVYTVYTSVILMALAFRLASSLSNLPSAMYRAAAEIPGLARKATVNTTIPTPPTHCSMLLHSLTDSGISSTLGTYPPLLLSAPVSMESPVVVQPATVSSRRRYTVYPGSPTSGRLRTGVPPAR